MRGRKPTPVELQRRRGNPGHRPLPDPVLVGGRVTEPPPPPDHLPEDARRAWDVFVPTLCGIGALDAVDLIALEGACVAYGRARQAARVIAEQGHVVEGSMGQMVEHPSLGTERAEWALFLRFAEQYGLTMLARTRAGLAELQRRSLAEELGTIFAQAPAAIDGDAVEVCGECGSRKGRRHADHCSRRRRRG